MRHACALAVLASFLIGAGSCGSGGDAADGGCEGDPGVGVFGDDCTVDDDCASCVCFEFGTGTWCTIRCTSDDDCPEGSQGRKCNGYGYCRP